MGPPKPSSSLIVLPELVTLLPFEVPKGNGFSVLLEDPEVGRVLGGRGGGVAGRNLSGLNESPVPGIAEPEQKSSEGLFLHANSLIENRRTLRFYYSTIKTPKSNL